MKIKLTTLFGIIGLSFGSLLFLSCDDDGPAEEAGEELDDNMEEAGDDLEDAGDELEDEADEATD